MEAVREEEGNKGSGDEDDDEEEEEEEEEQDEEELDGQQGEAEASQHNEDDSTKGRPLSLSPSSTPRPSHKPLESESTDPIAAVEEQLAELVILDEPNRSLSRSPPNSRPSSPRRSEPDSDDDDGGIKTKVQHDLSKRRAQQQRKYHSKRSIRNAGRPQGSKAKQDKRIKRDQFWD